MAKQSPLLELHKRNGAVFSERDGWLLPEHFGDPLREYDSVRSRVGVFDLSDRAFLSFTGPDRLSFLQGMVSNDLRLLKAGQGIYAAFLTQPGKVLADTVVYCTEDSFIVDLWEPLREKIVAHLNRYLVADEVEIEDLTNQYGALSLQGPDAGKLLQGLFESPALPQDPFAHCDAEFNNAKVGIIQHSRTCETGFDLTLRLTHLPGLAQKLQDLGKFYSASWCGRQAQEILRIEAGLSRYGVDLTEDNLLLETGLDHAVSFTKGCYLGQEVVERIRSRGHVNKRLCGLVIDADHSAHRDDLIYAGDKQIGIVTSAVYSPALKRFIALGYLHRDHWDAGIKVTIRRNGGSIESTVTALPFVSRRT